MHSVPFAGRRADPRLSSSLQPALASPSVSVVICNHNHGAFLEEAIASALQQSTPCEVVVVDDGSTDHSRCLLAQADPRVHVVLQANGGQVAAYNSGFQRSTGDVVLFLDADDALEPDAVARLLPCFGEGVVKVHFRMALVDAAGRRLGGVVPTSLAQGDVLAPLLRHGLLYSSAPGSGNAYQRSALQRLFPLPADPVDRVGADFFTIYGTVVFGRVARCDGVLARYRMHRPAAEHQALVFGNAALGHDEAARVRTRYARLVGLVDARTQGRVRLPPTFLDFSVQKSTFAMAVLAQPYIRAWFSSGAALTALLRALWLHPSYGLRQKLGLSAWAGLMMLAPRSAARRLARYVCNPASRSA